MCRDVELEGYELYIVEQWACSRENPTFVIATYTGNPSHTIRVSVLSIPKDISKWTPPIRVYFKSLDTFHARPIELDLGIIHVTNLSSFPSALTVIPVPDGDVAPHRTTFMINENLKRMGCTGRTALSLREPSDNAKSKFYSTYKVCDKIPFDNAVIELVRLIQNALSCFFKETLIADGLLCDVTEDKINFWWSRWGRQFYYIEPEDGILGPTTVAAILGMVLGARNRLGQIGAPIPKDALDVLGLKKAIMYFQKQQQHQEKEREQKEQKRQRKHGERPCDDKPVAGVKRSRRLDTTTLGALYAVTSKNRDQNSAPSHFIVPDAIIGAVAGIGGKVSGREKKHYENLAMETTNLDVFIQNVSGERAKYLWLGKKRKSSIESGVPVPRAMSTASSPTSTQTRYVPAGLGMPNDGYHSTRINTSATSLPPSTATAPAFGGPNGSPASSEFGGAREHPLRKSMFKNMVGSDSKGIGGKIKDAVHNRRHSRSKTKDGIDVGEEHHHHHRKHRRMASQSLSPQTEEPPCVEPEDQPSHPPSSGRHYSHSPHHSARNSRLTLPLRDGNEPVPMSRHNSRRPSREPSAEPPAASERGVSPTSSRAHPHLRFADEQPEYINAESAPSKSTLRRQRSFSRPYIHTDRPPKHDEWYPRRLSFSMAEDYILKSRPFEMDARTESNATEDARMAMTEMQAWTAGQLEKFAKLDMELIRTLQHIKTVEREHIENLERLEAQTVRNLPAQINPLSEMLREVETLGAKLQYEVQSLRGKVKEVEETVENFGGGVERVEEKAAVLEVPEEKTGWWEWGMGIVRKQK